MHGARAWGRVALAGVWFAGSLTACGPSLQAAITQDRYQHATYGYEVLSVRPGAFAAATDEWKLDNLHFQHGRLMSKGGAEYEVRYFVDIDDDGKSDDLGVEYAYDLRMVNLRDAGVMWLRTLPLHPDDRQRDLRVLAEQYVSGVSGTHYELAQLEGALYRTHRAQTYAVSVVDRATGQVAGQEAYAITLDVADVHQLQIDPNARRQRVVLVLVRTPFVRKEQRVGSRYELPVLMVAGYANLPEDFARGFASFESLLDRIRIQGRKGLALRSERAVVQTQGRASAEALEDDAGDSSDEATVTDGSEPGDEPEAP